MIIETHCHTSGISVCADQPYKKLIAVYEAAGYGGLVLTNHYNEYTLRRLGDTVDSRVERYIDEVRKTAAAAENCKVMLGAEVAISVPSGWAEFLLFGLKADFLRANPELYNLTQKQLFRLCDDNGIVMVQSHPFRSQQGHEPQDPEYMHGVEINCHPGFFRDREKVTAFAQKHGLLVTCGSDYHGAHFKPYGGIEADVSDVTALAQALRENAYEIVER